MEKVKEKYILRGISPQVQRKELPPYGMDDRRVNQYLRKKYEEQN